MPDGFHELRVVAVMRDNVATQGRMIIPFQVNNRGATISVRQLSPTRVPWDGQISLDVECANANRLIVFNQHNLIAVAPGPRQIMSISPRKLGLGPVSLLVAGIGGSKLENVFAPPVDVEIQPGPLLRARPSSVGAATADGIQLTLKNGIRKSVASTGSKRWLKEAGVNSGESFTITATFDVPRTAVYQFQVQLQGSLLLQVDGQSTLQLNNLPSFSRHDVPLYLEHGSHRLRIIAACRGPKMLLGFGEFGTPALQGPMFQHVP